MQISGVIFFLFQGTKQHSETLKIWNAGYFTCFWLWCLCVQRLEGGCFGVRFQVSLQARLTLFQSLFVCCPSLGFFGFSITALTVILCGAKSWTSLAPIQTSLAPIWTKGWTVIAGLAEKFFLCVDTRLQQVVDVSLGVTSNQTPTTLM